MNKKILHTAKIKSQLTMACVGLILLTGVAGCSEKSPKPQEAIPIDASQKLIPIHETGRSMLKPLVKK